MRPISPPDFPVAVRVTPKASENRFLVETQEDGTLLYKVYVTAVPEDGKANAAVLKMLSKAWGVPKSRLDILRGSTGRDKLVDLKSG